MSKNIPIRTLKAGAFATALTLCTLTMTSTASAACAWWQWGCVDTPVATTPAPEPAPIPNYETTLTHDDCWSWVSWSYDSACEKSITQAQNLAKMMNRYSQQKAEQTKEPDDWNDTIWSGVFGLQKQNWSGHNLSQPIPHTLENQSEANSFTPHLVQAVWNEDDALQLQQVSFVAISPIAFQLGVLDVTPKTVDGMFHKIKKAAKTWTSSYTSAEILITMAWANANGKDWLLLTKTFGHPNIALTNASIPTNETQKTVFKRMFDKAIALFNSTPLALTPGVGVGIVESVGDDIASIAGLGSNMFYIVRAYLTPSIVNYVYNPFTNPYYLNAVAYFTNMKDGVYQLLSSDRALDAMKDYYANIAQKIADARADANLFMVGRLVGNVAYEVIGSFTPKGLLTSTAKLSKISKISCPGKSCNKKGQGRQKRKNQNCTNKRDQRNYKMFVKNVGKELTFNPGATLTASNCKIWKAFKDGKSVPRGLVAIGTPGNDEVGFTSKKDGVSINMSSKEYEAWLLGTSRKPGKGRRYYRTTDSRCGVGKTRGNALAAMLKKASGFKASTQSDFLTK